MTSPDKNVIQFEQWLKDKMPLMYRLAFNPAEDDEESMVVNAKSHVLDMRQAWVDSRSMLVITLPRRMEERTSNDIEAIAGNLMRDVCIEAIESTGVHVETIKKKRFLYRYKREFEKIKSGKTKAMPFKNMGATDFADLDVDDEIVVREVNRNGGAIAGDFGESILVRVTDISFISQDNPLDPPIAMISIEVLKETIF